MRFQLEDRASLSAPWADVGVSADTMFTESLPFFQESQSDPLWSIDFMTLRRTLAFVALALVAYAGM
ncbi:MAG: hypothetical protein VXY07_08720, partial [Planctomycetota bacterium]|nr:hypothetical protein [Planctomycetota bacterium]